MPEPIRILHLMNDFADSSISRIVERIIRSLGCSRYVWHVASLSGPGYMEPILKSLGAETVHFLPQQAQGPLTRRALRNYLDEWQIDIVHSHTPRTILECYGSTLGMKSRPRHLATKHLLFTSQDRRWGFAYLLLDRLSLYLPDHIAAVSESIKDHVKTLPGRWNGNLTTVQNAIPCEQFYQPDARPASRLNLGLAPDHLVFGFTGRIEPVKSLDLLLTAFVNVLKVHPEARLLLAGEGSQRADLENQAKNLGIDQAVIWTGFRADIPNLLAAMDIYVQPSLNEGLSLSILEAMSAGKALIATDVGGARELLCDRNTGLLIQPGSVQALSDAMSELCANQQLRTQLGESARQYVLDTFNLQRMVSAYDQIYQKLISEKR